MIHAKRILKSLPFLVLGACVSTGDGEVSRAKPVADVDIREVAAPGGARYCEARDTAPAIIETITEQVEISAARFDDTGKMIQSPSYQTVTRQEIIRERQVLWFKTPCATQMTPDFIASVQRALAVRGYYQGRDTGILDRPTKRAIRRLQAKNGLDSDVLSLKTARDLGLLAFDFVRG